MEFRLLGSLEVADDGRVLDVAGSKQKAVLALLLLNANQVVSSDRLIEELWHGRPPRSAVSTLQTYVSNLRRVLERGAASGGQALLLTRHPGYLMRVGPDDLDVTRFERLAGRGRQALEQGDWTRASDLLREALGLWRGEALADFLYEPFAQAHAARLEEARLTAVEDRISAELALGRHAQLVGELEALCGEAPLREHLRGLLMVALYRSGRQADALRTYQALRTVLAEELGLEPSPALQRLEQALLLHEPWLEAGPALPGEPVRAEAPVETSRRAAVGDEARDRAGSSLIGRQRELEALSNGLGEARAGRGGLFLVVGEPGIGKTELVTTLVDLAVEQGATAVWGRCWEGGAPAYWPWVQVLRGLAARLEPDTLQAHMGHGGGLIAHLLPELHDQLPPVSDEARTTEPDRFALFEAISSFLKSVARSTPVVVVLDDLHAADPPSIVLLRYLAQDLHQSRLLLVATHRDVGADPAPPIRKLLNDAARAGRVVALGGLEAGDVGRFLAERMRGPVAESLVSAIGEATGGNPFFLDQLSEVLLADGIRADEELRSPLRFRLPDTVRAAVRERLGLLSADTRQLLEVAAVVGQQPTLVQLEAACGVPVERLLDELDEAVEERILVEVEGPPRRYAFAHALLREALYAGLPAAERMDWHRRVGEALERLYRDDVEPHLAELAHHFVEAAGAAGAERAVDYSIRAGQRALHQLAYEEAAAQFRRALELLDGPAASDEGRRCEVLLALADAQWRSGSVRRAKQTYETAANLARKLGSADRFARAALGRGIGSQLSVTDHHLVLLLEEALEMLDGGDDALRARVLGRLAMELLIDPGSRPRRRALGDEAVAVARRVGDPSTLAYALSARHHALWGPDTVEDRLRTADEILPLAGKAGDTDMLLQGHMWRLISLLELGDIDGVDDALRAYCGLAEPLQRPLPSFFATSRRAMRRLLGGDFTGAERLVAKAAALAEGAQEPDAELVVILLRVALYREQGRREELARALPEVQAWAERVPIEGFAHPWSILAWVLLELGRHDDAREVLERVGTHRLGRSQGSFDFLDVLANLSEVCASVGGRRMVDELYGLGLPYASRSVVAGGAVVCRGSMARYLGLLAEAAGRQDDAEGHFQAALEHNRRLDARPCLARTQYEYARLLLRRNGRADRDLATRLLTEAATTAAELGMKGLGADVEALDVAPPSPAAPAPATAAPPASGVDLRKDGEYWTIAYGGTVAMLKDSKGMVYLDHLLDHPGQEFHVFDLVSLCRPGTVEGAVTNGDAGELLDPQARAAYQRRLKDLAEDLEEAQAFNDGERAAQAQAEMEALVDHLRGTVALGGRQRTAPTACERARVSVTKAVRGAMKRIGEANPALGRHLAATVRTGIFCSYTSPDPDGSGPGNAVPSKFTPSPVNAAVGDGRQGLGRT